MGCRSANRAAVSAGMSVPITASPLGLLTLPFGLPFGAPPGGGIDFATFCEVMLPKNVEPSLANKIAEYMSKSFV